MSAETAHKDKRQLVFDAAEQVFAERGYQATTMQEIADSVCMAKGTLYHYFDSKQELFTSLMETRLGSLTHQFAAAFTHSQNVADCVEVWLQLEAAFFNEHQGLISVSLQAHAELPDTLRQRMMLKKRELKRFLCSVFQKHISTDQEHVEFIVSFVDGAIKGTLMKALSDERPLVIDEFIIAMKHLLLYGITGERTIPHG